MPAKVLFLSNGHGEDLNASLVLQALRQECPDLELFAVPIVGSGTAYQKLGVPLLVPPRSLPSGGFIYMDYRKLWQDLRSGLLGLTWRQVQAIRRFSRDCDALFVAGDVVVLAIAQWFTQCPYAAFIVSTSAHYEGTLKVPPLTWRCLRSPRCQIIFTRDAYTEQDLHRRRIPKALFAGYPIMDVLTPKGIPLPAHPPAPKIALLPGSRLPEAARNLALLTQCITHMPQPVVAWAAVTADLYAQLPHWAESHHWQWREGILCRGDRTIYCYDTAFADVLHACDAVIGMAGTAIEQAVGLGKPVIQICGSGPQFTYRFAEAQMRLLGSSVRTIGTRPATPDLLRVAAQTLNDLLHDAAYLAQCRQNGQDRVGLPGGSAAIARQFREHFLT